jgi:hypothetical protein
MALDGVAAPDPDERLLALDEALTQLAGADPLAARVVEMHHFAGMAHEQVAAALSLSVVPGAAEMDLRPRLAENDSGRILRFRRLLSTACRAVYAW